MSCDSNTSTTCPVTLRVFRVKQMCDSLDLYGFDSYLGSKNSYKYHYFDDVQGFTGRHSFDLAIRVFRVRRESVVKGVKYSIIKNAVVDIHSLT
mgnify:FL=1